MSKKSIEKMLTFCRDTGIIIQPVIVYNHSTECRVESYIDVVKSHVRVGMLKVNVPLRFHGETVLEFCIKRNFTWYSQKDLIVNTIEHDHLQPAFDNTLKKHRLVRGSSFGDHFVEGIYLHSFFHEIFNFRN
jgi:hypothetical protein